MLRFWEKVAVSWTLPTRILLISKITLPAIEIGSGSQKLVDMALAYTNTKPLSKMSWVSSGIIKSLFPSTIATFSNKIEVTFALPSCPSRPTSPCIPWSPSTPFSVEQDVNTRATINSPIF